MPKVGMKAIRRKQLVQAAIATIHQHGFARATVARIAHTAGVSSGIVHHYFADKDELLFATIWEMLAELRRDTVDRQKHAASPRERINAIIHASFSDKQFDEQVFSAWLALYGNARQSDRLKRLLRLYHRRLHANLMAELVKLMDRERSADLAEGIGAMIDGLWLRYALTGRPDNPAHPRAITRAYFEASAGFAHL